MGKQKARQLTRFGSNVRQRREARVWTQEKLAEKADLDQTYISGIERGERNPTVLSISKLAVALKTSASTTARGDRVVVGKNATSSPWFHGRQSDSIERCLSENEVRH